MKTRKSTKKRPRPFMIGISEEKPSMSMKRFGYITLALSFFQVSCAHDGTVLTWLWNHLRTDLYSFLTLNPAKKFKVNGHLLKPHLTAKPPTLAGKVNLHLPKVHEDVTTLISSIIVASLSFVWLKTLNITLLGGTPRLS